MNKISQNRNLMNRFRVPRNKSTACYVWHVCQGLPIPDVDHMCGGIIVCTILHPCCTISFETANNNRLVLNKGECKIDKDNRVRTVYSRKLNKEFTPKSLYD